MLIRLGLPQCLYVLITLLGLVLAIRDHGKPRSKENAWLSLVSLAIVYALLIWGGFFR
jgi:hypothetical protein